jgi:hypothetical protein
MFDDTLGDLAAQKIQQLQDEALDSLQQDNSIEPEDLNTLYRSLYKKIEFQWRPEDQNSLVQIREAARTVIAHAFFSSAEALDRFYESFRVPLTNDHGVVKKDAEGRILWRTNAQGKPLEDFSLISGQDIEQVLLDLQREKLSLSQSISSLFDEALFAKYAFDDEWHEKYEAMIEGTHPMRTARANRDARAAKYKAFVHFCLWHRANELVKEMGYLMRLLEKVREWRIRENK